MRERLIEILQDSPYLCIGAELWGLCADYLLAEGGIVPPKIVYLIVNKGTPYAFVSGKSPDFMQLYEIKDLKNNGYYLTKEEAEQALEERNKQ